MFRVKSVMVEFIPSVAFDASAGLLVVRQFALESGNTFALSEDVVSTYRTIVPLYKGIQVLPQPLDVGHRIFFELDNEAETVSTWSSLQVWVTGAANSLVVGRIRIFQDVELHALSGVFDQVLSQQPAPYSPETVAAISEAYQYLDGTTSAVELEQGDRVLDNLQATFNSLNWMNEQATAVVDGFIEKSLGNLKGMPRSFGSGAADMLFGALSGVGKSLMAPHFAKRHMMHSRAICKRYGKFALRNVDDEKFVVL
jgi:hypothetical protein